MKVLLSEKELHSTRKKNRIYLYYTNNEQMLLYQISEELTEHFNELNINISNINLYKINYDTLNKDLKKKL